MSGRHTFAEVEHLTGTGELEPDDIHLPGVFVDEVLLASARRAVTAERSS
jgi:3-oxoacid CoA-transferase subunit A